MSKKIKKVRVNAKHEEPLYNRAINSDSHRFMPQLKMWSAKHTKWNEKQKDFYDKRDHKRMWHKKDSAFVRDAVKKFIHFSGLTSEQKILEIGCGAGRYTLPLLKNNFHITGIDLSQRFLDKLAADAERLNIPSSHYTLLCADVESFIEKNDEIFDAVIGFNVLHHLFDNQLMLSLLKERLGAGARLVFLEPHGWYPLHYVDALIDRALKVEEAKKDCIPQKIKRLMTQNGFQDVAVEKFGFFPPPLVDVCPWLLKIEAACPAIKAVSAFFMIKGFVSADYAPTIRHD